MSDIVWSPQALDDLESLRAYIAKDSPIAAARIALRIVDGVETVLSENPELGRQGRVAGTRELAIARTPYIVPYRVRGKTVEVLRVYHGARKWPDRF
jgi:toxin ParE1/3/4